MKYLTLTDKELEKNLKQLLKNLKKQGTISLSNLYDVPKNIKIEKPTIIFTQQAYDKMMALVNECDIEIAWHNTVVREGNTFTITDTLCYPQIAQATHVESCDDEYAPWRDALTDEEYNTLKMQGHSHVNMGVTPSSTDHNYYDVLMEHIKSYQIFIIMNKRGSMWLELRDVENNMLYSMSDLEVIIPSDDTASWAKEQVDKYVSKPKPVYYQQGRNVSYVRGTANNKKNTLTEEEAQEEAAWYNQLMGYDVGNRRY